MPLLAIILFVGTMLLSAFASARVRSAYARYRKMPAASGASGAEVAAQILRSAGISDVGIYEQRGTLTDHYDPARKRLVLSSDVYHGRSVASLSIAAHEAGHALQHQAAYAPLQWRMAAVGITQISSSLVMILPILGLITGFIQPMLLVLAIAWGVIMLFQLITLPVEFDASKRAEALLTQKGFIARGQEAQSVHRMLNAAAMTYVAAFITSLGYLLYHLLPLLTGRGE